MHTLLVCCLLLGCTEHHTKLLRACSCNFAIDTPSNEEPSREKVRFNVTKLVIASCLLLLTLACHRMPRFSGLTDNNFKVYFKSQIPNDISIIDCHSYVICVCQSNWSWDCACTSLGTQTLKCFSPQLTVSLPKMHLRWRSDAWTIRSVPRCSWWLLCDCCATPPLWSLMSTRLTMWCMLTFTHVKLLPICES